ncbi:MAG: sugar transferase [Candidatus Omnitrophota bacterium]
MRQEVKLYKRAKSLKVYEFFKRIFDVISAIIAMIILSIPMLIISFLINIASKGPVFHVSERVGINNTIFDMYKFRTMCLNSPQLATHLMKNPDQFLTPIGKFLRRTSLDELPQVFNILKGDMSFVGPRPALFNQDDLVALRTKKGVHKIIPGLTGWAQVNGRDELPIPVKVEYDDYYLLQRSFLFDLKILWVSLFKAVRSEGVQH